MDCELSYEEEQLQQILMNEINIQKTLEERELKIKQDKEYEDSLLEDLVQNRVNDNETKRKISENITDIISVEEMRRIRILRFEKNNSKNA